MLIARDGDRLSPNASGPPSLQLSGEPLRPRREQAKHVSSLARWRTAPGYKAHKLCATPLHAVLAGWVDESGFATHPLPLPKSVLSFLFRLGLASAVKQHFCSNHRKCTAEGEDQLKQGKKENRF
jgi:hypothetical protein